MNYIAQILILLEIDYEGSNNLTFDKMGFLLKEQLTKNRIAFDMS